MITPLRKLIILPIVALIAANLSAMVADNGSIALLIGENVEATIASTFEDFVDDLAAVGFADVEITSDPASVDPRAIVFILGTVGENEKLAALSESGKIELSSESPGARGGLWAQIEEGDRTYIVLAGSDTQGFQYAVYDFARDVLGIDPLAYWTGTKAAELSVADLTHFENRVIEPPVVPWLCYFENDVDELANLQEPLLEYSWEDYTAMIDSLVRLRYNMIQPFDMRGRAEYYLREEYQKMRPNYELDWDYLERMIDYAHLKGMKVNFDMSLGSKLGSISQKASDCWSEYKHEWIAAWERLILETPVGKGDVFGLRPRNQIWDWPYKSSCGENTIEVMNEAYQELGDLIDRLKPGALKLCVCYHDGMDMFNEGLNPPKDFIIVWSDNGWGDFKSYPDANKGYQMGTYMHAGFWLNHDVADPYPEVVDTVMKTMFNDYEATTFCEVNGQTFRPFILNLEAYSEVCRLSNKFDGDAFYQNWSQRYFDDPLAEIAVDSFKLLHQAHLENTGYVEHLWEIKEAIAYLSNRPLERPRRDPIDVGFPNVADDIEPLIKKSTILQQAVSISQKGLELESRNLVFYHDHIVLPILIFSDLVRFERTLHELALLKYEVEKGGKSLDVVATNLLLEKAKNNLNTVYERRMSGDRNKKWAGWYDPSKRRPNNGFPTPDMLNLIEEAVESTWNKN